VLRLSTESHYTRWQKAEGVQVSEGAEKRRGRGI
jgi:hypothetical protein